MFDSVLKAYNICYDDCIVEPLVGGLINRTWKVTVNEKQFILQRINDHVFKKPLELAENIRMLEQYLLQHSPAYLFVPPIKNNRQDELVFDKQEGCFRLFPFIPGSHTINVVTSPDQAFEASHQFGKFAQHLTNFDATQLHITIPDFHNLTLRYHQFEESLTNGNADRIKQSASLIADIHNHRHILATFEKIKRNTYMKQRVMHHDTKISNVLFDNRGRGICIIDLDTVMPGYFISDLGDMIRTYLSPVNEEEKDFSKIEVRDDFFRAIVQGYLSNMNDVLTSEEKKCFFYAGQFLMYMQALRFLTDYCNNDVYYGARYADQNFVRAGNQLHLLKKLEEKREVLQQIILEELT